LFYFLTFFQFKDFFLCILLNNEGIMYCKINHFGVHMEMIGSQLATAANNNLNPTTCAKIHGLDLSEGGVSM
jgi:hypothetical protein